MADSPNKKKKLSFGEIGKLRRTGQLPNISGERLYEGDVDITKSIVSMQQPINQKNELVNSLLNIDKYKLNDNKKKSYETQKSTARDSQYRMPEDVENNQSYSTSSFNFNPDTKAGNYQNKHTATGGYRDFNEYEQSSNLEESSIKPPYKGHYSRFNEHEYSPDTRIPKYDNGQPSSLKVALQSFLSGTYQAGASALKSSAMLLKNMFGKPDMESGAFNKAIDIIGRNAYGYYEDKAQDIREDLGELKGFKRFLQEGIEPIPQIVASALIGGATGTSIIPFAAMAGGSYAREAELEGASPMEQFGYGFTGGVIEGASEKIVLNKVLGIFNKAGAGKLIDKGAKNFIGKYGKAALEIFTGIGEEVAQEIVVDPLSGMAKKAIYNHDMPMYGDGGVIDPNGMLDTARGALSMSLILTALGLPVAAKSHTLASKQVENKLQNNIPISEQATAELKEAILEDFNALGIDDSVVDNIDVTNIEQPQVYEPNVESQTIEQREAVVPADNNEKYKQMYNITDQEINMLESLGMPINENGLSEQQIKALMIPGYKESLYAYNTLQGKFTKQSKAVDSAYESQKAVLDNALDTTVKQNTNTDTYINEEKSILEPKENSIEPLAEVIQQESKAEEIEKPMEINKVDEAEIQTEDKPTHDVKESIETAQVATEKESTKENNQYIIKQDKHTKTGEDLWVVKLPHKVDTAEYKEHDRAMRKLGGYYSSVKKGHIFKSDPTALIYPSEAKTDNQEKAKEKEPIKQEITTVKETSKQELNDNKISETANSNIDIDKISVNDIVQYNGDEWIIGYKERKFNGDKYTLVNKNAESVILSANDLQQYGIYLRRAIKYVKDNEYFSKLDYDYQVKPFHKDEFPTYELYIKSLFEQNIEAKELSNTESKSKATKQDKAEDTKDADNKASDSKANTQDQSKTDFKAGDRVQYKDRSGKILTGTIKRIDDYSSINPAFGMVADVKVDQIATYAGGVPIGRSEIVPFSMLEGIDKADKQEKLEDIEHIDSKSDTIKDLGKEETSKPHRVIANAVKEYIENNEEKLTTQRLFEIADSAYGGTMGEGKYTSKDATDALELGVNMYLLDNMDSDRLTTSDITTVKNTLAELEQLLVRLPTQTKRTAEMEEFQQFSTPPNIAYVAAWTANINKDDIMLEPSAGVGGIASFAKIAGAEVVVNELSSRRAELIKELEFSEVFTEDAEQINNILPDSIKPTVIVMNPPFSATAGRMQGKRSTKFAAAHIEQALHRLQPNGRLVAIVGRGMSDASSTFRDWWNKIKSEYNVKANVGIDGSNYSKYGTAFDIQLLVIDKTGKTNNTITGSYDSLEEVIDILEGVRNEGSKTNSSGGDNKQAAHKSGGKKASDKGEAGGRTLHSTYISTDAVGDSDTGHSSTWSQGDKVSDDGSTGIHDNASKRKEADKPDRTTHKGGGADKGDGSPVSSGVSAGGAEMGTGGAGHHINVETLTKSEKGRVKDIGDSVYSVYSPQKLKIKGAKPHPGNLSQSAAMAAVEPPNPTYKPSLPKEVIDNGLLSIAQLEAVVYAGQVHEQLLPDGNRRGFFIGDGTGVGKGREISGIIMDNMLQGRTKAVWISKNDRLFPDAQRDWGSLGNDASKVFLLNKTKLGEAVKHKDGILFTTYGTLTQNLSLAANGEVQANGSKMSRLEQIVNWLGKDFNGVVAFDESHMMQNSVGTKGSRGIKKPSIRGLSGLELQKRLPKARIVYVSATGATEVSNFAYAERLGLWGTGTPFANKNAFISKISEGGLAAMELVARDMKAMGVYIARSLSYDGIKYSTLSHQLTEQQKKIYDTMARGWQIVLQNIEASLKETKQNLDAKSKGVVYGKFWSSQQRFFNQILTSMQMPSVVEQVKKDLEKGYAVVMQLVNTNESTQNRAIERMDEEDTLEDLDFTPREVLMRYLDNAFPIQQFEEYTDENGNVKARAVYDSQGNPVYNKTAVRLKKQLMEELGAMKVPEGVLEIVLNTFGTDKVAEVTGRTRRVVKLYDEATGRMKTKIESRTANHIAADADAFMDDKKNILIFSDAGGTGKSYHADLTKKNQRLRKHYLIQPGWRADNAVQGFGRTHRTNQAQPPEYILVTTNLKGQKRFISSIARRLDQLGALTKGQRQTGSQGLFSSRDNLEGVIAKDALARFYYDLYHDRVIGFSFLELTDKLGLKDKLTNENGGLNDSCDELRSLTKFLNRILSLESDIQNDVFDAFSERLDTLIDNAIANGILDVGLENYKAFKVEKIEEAVIREDEVSGAQTKYYSLKAYHKVDKADFEDFKRHRAFIGYYQNEKSNSIRAVVKGSNKTKLSGDVVETYVVFGQKEGSYETIEKEVFEKGNWKQLSENEAKLMWEEALEKTPDYDEKSLHLISGTLLPIWDKLPEGHVRVIRVLTADGDILLGRMIPEKALNNTLRKLGAERKKGTYKLEEVLSLILDKNYKAELSNGWSIQRKRVANEYRLELIGINLWEHTQQLKSEGAFTETIQFKTRYFIPTGDKALEVLNNIIKYRPIEEVVPPDSKDAYSYSPILNAAGTSEKSHNHQEQEYQQYKDKSRYRDKNTNDANTKPDKVKTMDEIVEMIERVIGVPIRTGKFRHKSLGIFKIQPEVIRTKITNDMPTIAHELGHYFDKIYDLTNRSFDSELIPLGNKTSKKGYTAQQRRKEGVAEFLRLYITDPETATNEAPRFLKYFESNMLSDVLAFLGELRSELVKINSLPTHLQTKNDISFFEKRTATKLNNSSWFERLTDAWLDEQLPFKRLQKEIGKVSSNRNFALKADLYKGVEAKVKGNLTIYQTDLQGNKVGEALKTILKPIKSSEYKDFANYMVSRRAIDYEDKGFVLPQPYWKYQDNVIYYDNEYPHFEAVFEEIREWENNNLKLLSQAGIMSRKTVNEIIENNPNHIPLYRIQEAVESYKAGSGNSLGKSKNVIKRAKGGGQTIIDPIESLVADAYIVRSAAEANDVLRTLSNQAEKIDGFGWAIEKIPPQMKGISFEVSDIKKALEKMKVDTTNVDLTNILSVFKANYSPRANEVLIYRNGKPELYQIDPELYKAIKGLNREASHFIIREMSRVKGILQTGVVTSVKFIMRNIARDTGTALINSEADINPYDLIKGYISAAKKDEWYQRYVLAGGNSEWIQINNRKEMQQAVRGIMNRNFASKFVDILLHPFLHMKDFIEFTEAGPRVAEFRKTVEKTGDKMLAAQRARDITIDFKQHGYYGKEVNKITAFFNANVQGQYKLARTFVKHPYKTMVKGFLYITLPTLILHAINDDNEEYQSMSIYRKALFYNIPIDGGKRFISIPKPFDWGVIFGAVPEFLLEEWRTKDKKVYENIMESIKLSFGADLMPQAIKPIWEANANKDWKGQAIETMGDQRVSPYLRYDDNTSTVAKTIANAVKNLPIPEELKSPKKLDYMIKGYLGTLGAEVRDIPDKYQDMLKNPFDKEGDISDVPVIGSFVTDPLDYPSEITEFFDEYYSLQTLYNDSKKSGVRMSNEDLGRYNRLKHFYKNIDNLYDKINIIEKDNKLKTNEKQKLIDKYKLKVREFSKKALDKKVSGQ